jgi:hypothetical protein
LKKKQVYKIHNPVVPSGLIAHTDKGYFYIKGKKKFKFVSERAMLTWKLPVVKTQETMLSAFQMSGALGLRDGTLVKNVADGKMYLVSDSKLRHITDADILEWWPAEIVKVGDKEISAHTQGETL